MSRKRNKKKKLPPKTIEPLTVNKKPNTLENDKKLPTHPERSSVEAAESSLKLEPQVSGFGIVLESSSSDVSRSGAVNYRTLPVAGRTDPDCSAGFMS